MSTVSAIEIRSERLVLRRAQPSDVDGLVELQTDPVVRAHLGGPRPRAEVQHFLSNGGIAAIALQPGTYVVDVDGEFAGTIVLDRRAVDRPGHVFSQGEELELSYVLRQRFWGFGYASEAATAVLRAAASELPDQPVLLVTQTTNARSLALAARLGFVIRDSFVEYDAEQNLAVADLRTFA